jgi:outer membrane protein OmpA-like peptidoglycan-associated protein
MKHLLVVSMCLAGAISGASAQEVQTVETKTTQVTETVETVAPQTIECGHIDVSHFSFGVKTGVNYFTMSPPAPRLYDKFNLMVGGNIDYTINPMYGFGIEYLYNDYTRPYTYENVEGLLKGGTHDIVAYSSVNLCNTISPYRTGFWKNLNVYGDVGAGVAFFKYDRDYGLYTSTSTPVVVVKLGLNAEFTLSDYFNLCFEGQYRQYDTREMGGAFSNRNNEALIATMGLKYKIGYAKLKHARNISICDYSPRPAAVIVNNTTVVKGDTQVTLDRLSASENENNMLRQKMQRMREDSINANALNAMAVQNANDQKTNAQNALATQNANEQSALATQNANLKQNLSTQNSVLQQKLLTMEADIKRLENQKEGRVDVSIENIEFKTGSNDLTPASTDILDQVSSILINNAYWNKLRVIGHTDNVGTNASNQRLSESRALAVKEYLLFKGIPSKNLMAVGMGEEQPTESNATVEGRQSNRRVEFEISK